MIAGRSRPASPAPDSAPDGAADRAPHYVSDEEPGITRRRAGRGWSYRDPSGRIIRDRAVLDRIRALAIPPAYADVWICPSPLGHIQATGRDARGRKQYRYHAAFRSARDDAKFGHLLDFANALPRIRAAVEAHMARRGLPRDKVLATIVHLLEATMIRVGNADYARRNQSYGLTTLHCRHVRLDGHDLRFRFRGKSGRIWRLKLTDRRVARIVRQCQDLPGQKLFQYVDDEGAQCGISSGDVNDYLREISGACVTAKDFRTWTGTVLAATALAALPAVDCPADAKRNLATVMSGVAAQLGNTAAVCRSGYVHPQVIESYLAGALALPPAGRRADPWLSAGERAVIAFLLAGKGKSRKGGRGAG